MPLAAQQVWLTSLVVTRESANLELGAWGHCFYTDRAMAWDVCGRGNPGGLSHPRPTRSCPHSVFRQMLKDEVLEPANPNDH